MFLNFLGSVKDDRKKVIIIFVCITVVLVFARLINMSLKPKEVKQNSSSNNTTTVFDNSVNEVTNSIVAGAVNNVNNVVTSNSVNTSVVDVINNFFEFCNNQDVTNAYKMLSSDCKEILFNTESDFANKYFNPLFFNKSKTINLRKLHKNTYQVNFIEEAISTGNSQNGYTYDYVTVVNDNGTYKINVKGLVERSKISSNSSNEYMDYKIINKIVYVNYTSFDVTIKNTTMVDMTLSDLNGSKDISFFDSNSKEHYCDSSEFVMEDLTIGSKQEKVLTFKFNINYDENYNSKIGNKLYFLNVRLKNIKYYESVKDEATGNMIQVEKYTTYDPRIQITMSL